MPPFIVSRLGTGIIILWSGGIPDTIGEGTGSTITHSPYNADTRSSISFSKEERVISKIRTMEINRVSTGHKNKLHPHLKRCAQCFISPREDWRSRA